MSLTPPAYIEDQHVVQREYRHHEVESNGEVRVLWGITLDTGAYQSHWDVIAKGDVATLDAKLTPFITAEQKRAITRKWATIS